MGLTTPTPGPAQQGGASKILTLLRQRWLVLSVVAVVLVATTVAV